VKNGLPKLGRVYLSGVAKFKKLGFLKVVWHETMLFSMFVAFSGVLAETKSCLACFKKRYGVFGS